MCFHSRQTKKAAELENRFNAKMFDVASFHGSEHYNAFAYPRTPVIANNDKKHIRLFKWGLIPKWAKDETIREYTLNAKIETLKEKPSFKGSVNNRCLVISDGFFEWKWLTKDGKKKQKYLITLPDDSLFAFAGLWSEWVDKNTGEIIPTYTLVTTAANALMEEIHNNKKRMPVILTQENEQEWLQGKDTENFALCNVELKAEKI